LRVNRSHIGQDVTCKHCKHRFRAEAPQQPADPVSGEGAPGPAIAASQPVERIAVNCPGCQASLRVRRAYVGSEVRCKSCGGTFVVRVPAQPEPDLAEVASAETSATIAPAREALDEANRKQAEPRHGASEKLLADWEQLQAKHIQLESDHDRIVAEHERLVSECARLREQKDRLASELETIRAGLGTVAPEAVRPLAEERESLRAEVKRLLEQVDASSRAEQAARAEGAALRQQCDVELAEMRSERESLFSQVAQLSSDLEAAHAERGGLSGKLQDVESELEGLRGSQAAREQEMKKAGEALAAEADGLRQSLEHAQRLHQDDLARLDEQCRLKQQQQDAATVLRGDGEQLRRQIEGLRQDLDRAERARRDGLARLNEQRQLTQQHEEAVTLLRAEHQQLRGEHEQLRGEREQLRGEREQLRGEIEGLRNALDLAERARGDDLDQLAAELAALGEQHRHLQEEHASTEESSAQNQCRNQELALAHAKLEADYQSLRDSARLQQEAWEAQLRELQDQAAERAACAGAVSSENVAPAPADGELQSAHERVRDLERRLDEAARINREILGVLDGLGIGYTPMKLVERRQT
jgi:predicted Zn finger-like uncharacterized protein